MLLRDRILKMSKTSGYNSTFFYLKEVLRLTIRFLAGQAEPNTFKLGSVLVKRDHLGLPTIIPSILRKLLVSYRDGNSQLQSIIVCILTCLSIFRVMSTKVRASLKSIITPFGGISPTIESGLIKRALAQLPIVSPRTLKSKVLLIETAGPNAQKATWSATLDAVAFLFYPKVFYHYVKYNFMVNSNGWKFNVWVSAILLASLPVQLIILFLGGSIKLCIGKLGVVFDQAGKARIVGITNYWIQVALYPLHRFIFRILERIPMDGTFNQESPVRLLISRVKPGQVFHSFDLSSATDRLPLLLQRDILNIISPNLGNLWGDLLGSLTWLYQKREIVYSVGQPMGAYSSWAMLALTHHVIVMCASIRAGKFNFQDYAVLGDDIVIADDSVAQEYLAIMSALGVSINLSKSLQSDLFCEFAKKWIGPKGVELSPIGPGLLLRLTRNKFFLAALLAEMFKLKLINSFAEVLDCIHSLPPDFRSQQWNALWAAFGLKSFLNSGMSRTEIGRYLSTIVWCFSAQGDDPTILRYNIWNALLQDKLDTTRNAIKSLDASVVYFLNNFWKMHTSKGWPNRLLEACLKMMGPGVWAYFYSFIETKLALDESLQSRGDGSWANIQALAQANDAINVSNIDWRERDKVKESIERAAKLVANYERTREETNQYGGGLY